MPLDSEGAGPKGPSSPAQPWGYGELRVPGAQVLTLGQQGMPHLLAELAGATAWLVAGASIPKTA